MSLRTPVVSVRPPRNNSRSAFLLYLNVKLVPFFAFILEGRRISVETWVSAFLAFVGTVLLSSDGTPPNAGDLWSVLAAATSAMFILRLEKYSSRCDASRLNSANLWITAGLCGLWAGGPPAAVVLIVRYCLYRTIPLVCCRSGTCTAVLRNILLGCA